MKTQNYDLNAGAIETILEDIASELNAWKVERRNMLRIRLTIEELLLRLLHSKEPPREVSLISGRRLGRLVIRILYEGAPFDPIIQSDEDDWSARILDNLGLSPSWSYRGKKNRIDLRLPRASGRGTLFAILAALAGAVVIGALGMLLPESFRAAASDLVLTQFLDMFLGLLNTFAGIMIAFTVISGILGVGDAAALDRIGKYVLLRFFIIIFIVSALTLAFALPFLRLPFAFVSESGTSQALQVVRMLFDIIPKNLIAPFLNANTMQIIVLALFTGIVLLAIREKAPGLCALADEGARLTQAMMAFVCRLIPLFIFCSLLRQIWAGKAGDLLRLWKPLCLYLAVLLLVTAAALLISSRRVKRSPLLLLKLLFPPFLIALTTASSMSAYSLSVETCKKKLGIDDSLVDFAFPIGVVVYMPGGTIAFAVMAGFLAELYQVPISLPWLLTAWLLCAMLSIALPPIPGAMLTCYGILLAQLGIPAEGLLLAAAFDVVQDFTSSGFDILLLLLEQARQAALLGKLSAEAPAAAGSAE